MHFSGSLGFFTERNFGFKFLVIVFVSFLFTVHSPYTPCTIAHILVGLIIFIRVKSEPGVKRELNHKTVRSAFVDGCVIMFRPNRRYATLTREISIE